MTISPRTWDTTGNHQIEDGIQLAFNTMTNAPIAAASQPSIVAGSGTPTFSAIKGTLYIKIDGSTTSDRLFINNGTTNWVAITTAS